MQLQFLFILGKSLINNAVEINGEIVEIDEEIVGMDEEIVGMDDIDEEDNMNMYEPNANANIPKCVIMVSCLLFNKISIYLYKTLILIILKVKLVNYRIYNIYI